MPQIPPLLTLAKFSAFSKQLPSLRKKTPHNTTTNQNKQENPSSYPCPDRKPLDASCPHLSSASRPGHHPGVIPGMGTTDGGGAGPMVARGRQGTLVVGWAALLSSGGPFAESPSSQILVPFL